MEEVVRGRSRKSFTTLERKSRVTAKDTAECHTTYFVRLVLDRGGSKQSSSVNNVTDHYEIETFLWKKDFLKSKRNHKETLNTQTWI